MNPFLQENTVGKDTLIKNDNPKDKALTVVEEPKLDLTPTQVDLAFKHRIKTDPNIPDDIRDICSWMAVDIMTPVKSFIARLGLAYRKGYEEGVKAGKSQTGGKT